MAVVDCRGLIEFCRAFEQHQHQLNAASTSPSARRNKSLNPLSFCEHSPFAAVDIVVLVLALVALAVLTLPSFKFLIHLLPAALDLCDHALRTAPVAYAAGFIVTFALGIILWEFISLQARKCGNPRCRGLRKAVEFDIQLESEECVKCLPPALLDTATTQPLELGSDHKELEAELKKMAPLNGRTVLIFRAPCGCPAGRMEVWGQKKVRRIRK